MFRIFSQNWWQISNPENVRGPPPSQGPLLLLPLLPAKIPASIVPKWLVKRFLKFALLMRQLFCFIKAKLFILLIPCLGHRNLYYWRISKHILLYPQGKENPNTLANCLKFLPCWDLGSPSCNCGQWWQCLGTGALHVSGALLPLLLGLPYLSAKAPTTGAAHFYF